MSKIPDELKRCKKCNQTSLNFPFEYLAINEWNRRNERMKKFIIGFILSAFAIITIVSLLMFLTYLSQTNNGGIIFITITFFLSCIFGALIYSSSWLR
jgi:hypothetical protein